LFNLAYWHSGEKQREQSTALVSECYNQTNSVQGAKCSTSNPDELKLRPG